MLAYVEHEPESESGLKDKLEISILRMFKKKRKFLLILDRPTRLQVETLRAREARLDRRVKFDRFVIQFTDGEPFVNDAQLAQTLEQVRPNQETPLPLMPDMWEMVRSATSCVQNLAKSEFFEASESIVSDEPALEAPVRPALTPPVVDPVASELERVQRDVETVPRDEESPL